MSRNTILTDRHGIKYFLIVFLINLLALSPLIIFSHIHYSVDTYGLIENWANAEWHIGGFRYFSALITIIVSALGHNPILNPIPDILFFIIIVALSVSVLSIYISNLVNKQRSFIVGLLVNISLLITACNVWYSNLLTFSESISLNAIGFLLCFLGVYLFAKRKSWLYLLIASIAFICATATTQQFISIFIIYTILILCIKQVQNEKGRIRNLIIFYLKPFVFIIVNSAIYYLIGLMLIKIFNVAPNPRASLTIRSIIENLIYFIKNQHSFLKGRGLFSSEILTICYLMVFVISIFSLIMFWRKSRQTAKTIFIGLSFVAAYICAYLPGLVSTSHGTRTICALFSVFALFAIGAVALYQHKITSAILACILFLVFALNVYKTVNMEVVQIIGNTNESTYADGIAYEIEKFEVSNGVNIKKIGVCYDKTPDINAKEIYHDYDAEAIICLHIKHPIEFVEVPKDIIQNNFAEKDWTSYDAEEQIVFDKNTAYVCVY